ncbi:hypothetical protein HYW17_02945 [Candidatus Uhrbacteria bacterium]|nr:hypothetical protein [Candidatus Uhrbacteria bacterium]
MSSSTVTLPKSRYEILKRRATLYNEMLRFIPELRWGIEEYSEKRIREFAKMDRIDRATRARLEKLLTV